MNEWEKAKTVGQNAAMMLNAEYWKQQADYYRDREAEANEQLGDLVDINAALEQRLEKAVEALRRAQKGLYNLAEYNIVPRGYRGETIDLADDIGVVIAAIEEPTDAN